MSKARRTLLKQTFWYAVSVAAVVVTFLGRQIVAKHLGTELPQYIVFFPVVTLAALASGLWAGLLATATAALLVMYWVIPPAGSFAVPHISDAVCLGIFVATAGLTSIVCEFHLRARREAAAYEKERALRQAEDARFRYELLSEHSRDIILFIRRQDGRILEANAAAIASYGYRHEDLLQLTIHQLRAPQTRALTQEQMEEATVHGIRFETIHQRKDGSKFPVEVSSQGTIIGGTPVLISVIRDISARKQGEEHLFKANQRLEALMNALPVGVSFSDDATCQRIRGNPAVLAQFGVGPEDNLSASAPDSLAPGRQVRFFKNGRPMTDAELPLQRAVKENRPIPPMELEVRTPDGRSWFTEASGAPIRDEQGKVIAGVAVTVDITERKNAEQAIAQLNQDLQRRAAELETIFNTAPIGLSLCQDPEGRHIRGNPANEKILGLAAGEELSVAGHKARFRAMRDGRELSVLELPMQRAIRGEVVSGSVLDVIRPDGSQVTLYASAAPLFDEENRPRGAVGAFLDITPLKKAEEALREASEHRRLALEGAELGCWDYQVGGEVTWDEPCRKMFGFTGGDRISKEAVFACVHEEDRQSIIQGMRDAIASANEKAFRRDFRVVWPDGSVRWLAAHARVYYEATGKTRQPKRFVGVTMNITEYRQAEEALRQNREWLRVTLTSIGDAVIAADTNGRVTFLNSAAAALTGWTSEEANGKPIQHVFRIFNEETGLAADDVFGRVLHEGRVLELANHTALLAKDGRLLPIEDSAAPIRDSEGSIVGVVLVFHDVTEKRRAQKALRQSKERYQQLVDLSPDAIIVHRHERIEYVNPAAARLFGASNADQLLGRSPYDIFHPDYHELVHERVQRLRQGEPIPLIEEKIVRLDGRAVDVAVTAALFVDQNGPAVQVIMHDITGRKLREEQNRRFNRTLKALNNSNQALLRATNEEELLKQVCKIITEDCGHAMVWISFAQNDEQKSVRPVAFAGFEEGYLQTLQISWADTERGQGPTGRAIRTGQPCLCRNMSEDPAFAPWRAEALARGYASSLAVPLLEEGKALGAITLYSKDPDGFSENEVKLLMELAADLAYGIRALRLREAHERAQEALIRSEKLASVGRMAATIAHEINNPLAAVMNTLFLARNTAGIPSQAGQYLEICDSELKRISHITRQALGFYRESTAPAITSVGAILDSVLDLLAGKINSKRVIVDKQYDHRLQLMAVAGELRQVFSNLVSNSIDALGEGGTIKLRVTSAHPGVVRVTVADNGKGIEATALPHIFEAFFTTKTAVGIGLGLWVSKQIVEKHGGSIRLRSGTREPRKGTVFSVVLPAICQPVAAAQAAGRNDD